MTTTSQAYPDLQTSAEPASPQESKDALERVGERMNKPVSPRRKSPEKKNVNILVGFKLLIRLISY